MQITAIVSLLLTIISLNKMSAQDYLPFVVEDKHWVIGKCGTLGGDVAEWYEYLLRGDTLIENTVYKKVYRRNFLIPQSYSDCDIFYEGMSKPYTVTTVAYMGAVREDIAERKVYLRASDHLDWGQCFQEGEEVLFHDFSLVPGDTFENCYHDDNTAVYYVDTLTEVSPVSDFYGIATRRYDVSGRTYEGIGLPLPFYRRMMGYIIFVAEGHFELVDVCVGSDETCLFTPSSTGPLLDRQAVRIVPSPSDGRFSLYTNETFSTQATMEVFDSYGRLLTQTTAADGQFRHGATLPAGIYFVRLVDKGRLLWSGKTVVE